ncbi:hypothetical protein LguiA_005599 [Lonicera macranthoides]
MIRRLICGLPPAGCIFSQLLTKRVCFQNNSSLTVLLDVFKILGTPMEERWVGVELSTLPGYINDYEEAGAGIETLVPEVEGDALDLLSVSHQSVSLKYSFIIFN